MTMILVPMSFVIFPALNIKFSTAKVLFYDKLPILWRFTYVHYYFDSLQFLDLRELFLSGVVNTIMHTK